ncbi:MAG: hypothetical protein JXX14_18755, partial [Deltaproteobacteria bacterium]|nr:hypothetical protein [Deltaproteobacteria bacterium]
AGVRAPNPAAVGRMVPISDDFEASNQDVRNVLNTVEPNHCSFDAAMFDDAGEYFYNAAEPRPAYNEGGDLFFNCRPRVVFFITDGIQTDALEFPQQYCSKDGLDGETNAPPPPWKTFDKEKIYNCPFNSTATEVEEMFEVVSELASGDANVQPMYTVVIGVNMKDKEGTPQNRCDVTNAVWQEDLLSGEGYCPVPADDCITLRELKKDDCHDNPESTLGQIWVTPRQYLNMLALRGWPEDPGGLYAFEAADGRFRQPPWRPQADGTLEWNFCDDKNRCGGETDDGAANGALFVESVTDLARVINMVLQAVAPETAGTRTEIVTATNPDASVEATDAAAQFMVNSGYRSSTGGPWQGYLYRQGQKCTYSDDETNNSTGGAVGDAMALHAELISQANNDRRRIFVRVPDATFNDLAYTGLNEFRDGKTNLLVSFQADNVHDDDLGITETGADGLPDYRDMVAKYLYGTAAASPRGKHPLGDIYNSTPAVLTRPTERVPLASYQKFQSEKWAGSGGDINNPDKPMSTRDPLLYVGTNDGILHSFNLMFGIRDNLNDVEGWGFVPSGLMETVGKQFPINVKRTYDEVPAGSGQWVSKYEVEEVGDGTTGYQHMFGVDAPPLAADVLLFRNTNATTTSTTTDTTEEKFWRSIVIGGLGKGGYGYYALDVTKGPLDHPVYRWELSPDEFGTNAPKFAPEGEDPNRSGALARVSFQKMGMGLARPELAYVYINDIPPNGDSPADHQIAVAILPGGYKSNEAGGIGVSTGVYIVRVGDGLLIRYLDPSNPADVIDNGMFDSPLFFKDPGTDGMTAKEKAMVAQLIGQPVVPNSIKSGKVADQAFIGDDRGRIWQIDMSSKYPSEWKLKVFYDTLLAEHYPYFDCMSKTLKPGRLTPTGTAFERDCCDAKTESVVSECTVDDKKTIFQKSTKDDFGIDRCSGRACSNPSFPFPRIPMLAPPTIVQDDERNNVLLFGTGQFDGLETLDHHRVFSVTQKPEISMGVDDKEDADTTNDETTSALVMGAPELNWWIGEDYSKDQVLSISSSSALYDLERAMFPDTTKPPTQAAAGQAAIDGFDFWGLGEKLLGRIFVFNKVAYFASFSPMTENSRNACNDGGSKIWGVNFDTLEVDNIRVFDKLDPATNGTLVPFKVYPEAVFTGLRLVRQPSCGGLEGFTLVAQKANPAAPATPSTDPTSDPPQIITESLPLPVPDVGFTRVGIDSWSIVMGGQ